MLRRVGQKQHDLLSTVAKCFIGSAAGTANRLGDRFQGAIACEMPIGVVVVFEVVHIDHCQTVGPMVAGGQTVGSQQRVVERASVADAEQKVLQRERLSPPILVVMSQGAFDRQLQLPWGRGLQQQLEDTTSVDGPGSDVHIGVTCHQDTYDVGLFLMNPGQEFDAIRAGHAKIAHHDCDSGIVCQSADSRFGTRGGLDIVFAVQAIDDSPQQIRIVIHYQYAVAHPSTRASPLGVAGPITRIA